MKFSILALLLTLTSASAAPGSSGEPGDDALKYLLSKSDLVVSGKITNMMVFTTDRTIYLFDCQIREVMKGNGARKGQTIAVHINRVEGPKSKGIPFLEEGSECILFLKSAQPPAKPPWREADYWFAVQPHSDSMVSVLKRLGAESKVEPSYQGRSLSEWILLSDPVGGDIAAPKDWNALSAVRAMGAEAIPWLLRWLRSDQPATAHLGIRGLSANGISRLARPRSSVINSGRHSSVSGKSRRTRGEPGPPVSGVPPSSSAVRFARSSCFRSFSKEMLIAFAFALASAGSNSADKRRIIETTTRISTSLEPATFAVIPFAANWRRTCEPNPPNTTNGAMTLPRTPHPQRFCL